MGMESASQFPGRTRSVLFCPFFYNFSLHPPNPNIPPPPSLFPYKTNKPPFSAIWTTFYIYGSYLTRQYFNWTGLGAAALIVLFQISTWLTELLSGRKYPEYKEYQKHVGMFVPTPWKGGFPSTRTSRVEGAAGGGTGSGGSGGKVDGQTKSKKEL